MRSIGPAVTREQSPAFLRNPNGRLDFPGSPSASGPKTVGDAAQLVAKLGLAPQPFQNLGSYIFQLLSPGESTIKDRIFTNKNS